MKKLLCILAAAVCALCSAFAKERKIAVQTYTCHTYTLEEMCVMFRALGVQNIELCSGLVIGGKYPETRLSYKTRKDSPEAFEYAREMFAKHGLRVISTGVHYPKTEQDVRDICEFTKALGAEFVSAESPDEIVKLWVKHLGGLKLAIHNHHSLPFADPKYVAKLVAPYADVGACADNGGWTRAGFDSIQGLKILRGKIFTVHLKDQEKLGKADSNAKIYGTGCIDLKGMLAELDAQNFDGYIIIEHGNYDDKFQVISRDMRFLQNN